jgi:prepilin-type N-terminal cleavage/methylation domain-containing protein
MVTNRPYSRALTLVELLVAMTILAIIAVLFAKIIADTIQVTGVSSRLQDVAGQARLTFDRIGLDLAELVRRADADVFAETQGATSTQPNLAFLSRVPSFQASPGDAQRTLSVLAYRIAPHPQTGNKICLQRSSVGVNWSAANVFGLTPTGQRVALSTLPGFAASNSFDVLADGVVRMAVGFQLRQGIRTVTLSGGSTLTASPGAPLSGRIIHNRPLLPGPGDLLDLRAIAALVVTVVVVDTKAVQLASAEQLSSFASQFATPADGSLAAIQWGTTLEGLSPADTFTPILNSARIFQRIYPLPFTPSDP